MTGLEWALLISSIAGSVGSMMGGSTQERNSFAGLGVNDPNFQMANIWNKMGPLYESMAKQASTPVRLRSSYAQSLNPMTGGGLPMDIGAGFGTDPALQDPSLLVGNPMNLEVPNFRPGPDRDPDNPNPARPTPDQPIPGGHGGDLPKPGTGGESGDIDYPGRGGGGRRPGGIGTRSGSSSTLMGNYNSEDDLANLQNLMSLFGG